MRSVKALALVIVVSSLVACVTTSDSSLTRNADPAVAVQRYVYLGLEYIKREEFNRARKHLLRALEIDEDNAAANSSMGLIYTRQGEKKLAEESFEKALDSDPSYTRGRTYYAAFLFSAERYEEAREQFLRAAEDTTFESRTQVYTNMALCSVRLGDTKSAMEAYERALQLDRFNASALAGLTEVLLDGDDYKRAQYYYNRLVNQIAQQTLTHSAQTLWQGVRIARHYNAIEQAESLALLLGELYPDSTEYKAYKNRYQ